LYLATLCPSWADDLRLLDGTPVPCGTSRQTVRYSDLAGLANYGYCAAHSRRYWGLKLYLLITAEGMPVASCLAEPKIGEREIAQELLGHARDTGALRDGMIVLCDKGLAGREMERYAADQVKVLLVRPDRKDEPRRYGNLGGMRQWIESVNDTLKGPAGSGTARRPYPGRGLRPHRPLAAGPGRLHLAQLADRRGPPAVPDRLRPLTL
jgi:hypothetical protein